MKPTTMALTAALVSMSTTSFAHGEPPRAVHGGQVQEASENWIELVLGADKLTLYVLDHSGRPIPASEVSGTTTVLLGGKVHKLELAPAAGNRLEAQLPVDAAGQVAGSVPATVSLKIAGKPASARFAITK